MKQWLILLMCLTIPLPALSEDCTESTQLVIQAFDLGHSPSNFPAQKQLIEKALKLCPNNAEAHNNLASILEKEKDYGQALHHYQQAVRAKSDFAVAWFGIGEVYTKTHQFLLALEAYLKACKADTEARKRIEELLKTNRYRISEAGELMNKESLLLLFDKNRRNNISRMLYDCGFRANVKPEVIFRNLLFDTGLYQIRPESIPQIQEIGAALQVIGSVSIKIIGHTDRQPFKGYSQSESDHMNLKLSRDRAASVADYLIRMGISQKQIHTKGLGPNNPEMNADTPEAYAKNRRVVIEVTE
ncbi:OmpA family protein [Desulfobacterales bacterium HSG16]|nr:OmpA family protein [Desulfobacterales bacterium HSG16]